MITQWTAAVADQVCKAALWDRIAGWEVVAAVLFIVAGYVAVQVSRLYFIAVVARIGNDPIARSPKDQL